MANNRKKYGGQKEGLAHVLLLKQMPVISKQTSFYVTLVRSYIVTCVWLKGSWETPD